MRRDRTRFARPSPPQCTGTLSTPRHGKNPLHRSLRARSILWHVRDTFRALHHPRIIAGTTARCVLRAWSLLALVCMRLSVAVHRCLCTHVSGPLRGL